MKIDSKITFVFNEEEVATLKQVKNILFDMHGMWHACEDIMDTSTGEVISPKELEKAAYIIKFLAQETVFEVL